MNIYLDSITVSAYCRVSTDKTDQANSFNSQIKYFTDYIGKIKNWSLGEIYFDEGISGTSIKKRQGFNRMIADGLGGKFNLVITKEVSRFARNTVDTLTYTRLLKESGVGVYFLSDNINTLDKDGELRLTIMASLAQEESRKTSERVKWGQKRRMEAGVVFGRDLLGYYVKNGSLIVNDEEAEIVRLIFYKYVNEGKSAYTIAKELCGQAIKPKRAARWSNTMILKILRNEKYVGDLCQKKTYTPNYLTHQKKYNRGHEDKVYLHNHHQPIISRDIWSKAQAELLRRSPCNQKSKYSNRYWCSGKIICGECGKAFVARTKILKSGKKYKAWQCRSAAEHGSVGCKNSRINDPVLLNCVSYIINSICQNKKNIADEVIEEIKKLQSASKPPDTCAITAKIEKLRQSKIKAIDLCVEGLITREDLKNKNLECDKKIQQLLGQLLSIKNASILQSTKKEKMQAVEAEVYKIMQLGAENELLHGEHLSKIVVFKDKSLVVYLKDIPYKIKVFYKKSGRGDSLSVEFKALVLDPLS